MPDYGTNLALFAPSGFPQLGVLIRREFQPQAAPAHSNCVFESLVIFEVQDVPTALSEFNQLRGIRKDHLPRQGRFQILLKKLAVPSFAPHEVQVDPPFRAPLLQALLAELFSGRMGRRQRPPT